MGVKQTTRWAEHGGSNVDVEDWSLSGGGLQVAQVEAARRQVL
jgi:hypothetical protein